jgi:hypothetical protein
MSTNPLQRLEPADRPLLTLIFDRVDDSMLVEIANADYGDDADIHLKALQQIRANQISVPMQWHPGEVLELTRWTEPDNLNGEDKAKNKRGHWIRLFACTVLIWASLEPENYEYNGEDWNHIDGEDSTIIQFLDSALKLGEETSLAALQFLSWRMQSQLQRALRDEDFGNCPCYAVAMLLLCVSLNRCVGVPTGGNPEIVSFLISVAHCNDEGFPISREIGECLRSQKWQDTIHKILLDRTASNYARLGKAHAWRTHPEIQNFGIELIGTSGIKRSSL